MRTSKQIGYAVVGLGRISEVAVLPAFSQCEKSRLIAVVSGDARKARRLGKRFGAGKSYTYDQLEECLADPLVQAVYIATNNSTHAEFTMAAAEAGKHVLCEKPMAPSVKLCQKMIDSCRAHCVKLMIAYRKYLEPASIEFKRLVRSGRLGRLKIIHTAFTFYFPAGQTRHWHMDRQLSGGGALVDVGVYCVNTVRWLLDQEPMEATAYSWTVDPHRFVEVEESISFQLKFPEGILMEASASFGAAQCSFIQVMGEKGWAALNPAYAFDEERRIFGKIGGKWFEKKFEPMEEFHLELDHLAECIQQDKNPLPDGEAGKRDVAVMEAIYEAARRGKEVAVRIPA
jgi:predicted dehydrogenase